MKHVGIAIPGYALDKNGKPRRSTKRLSVSKQIAVCKGSKRISFKRGKRVDR